jgi:uncharacterized protein YwgA
MSRPSAIQGILEIAAASGGQIDTRIRLQKEAFLLACLQRGGFSALDFEYHHYGPYSRSVSDALRFAVAVGYLNETPHPFDEHMSGIRYSYDLTDAGRQFVQQSETLDQRGRELVEFLSGQHWRALELASTVKFLEAREGFHNRNEAFSEAIRLKPATANYQSQAQAVLHTLDA